MSASAPSPSGPAHDRRYPVAVLGATGAVGQAFVRLLVDHPWFELVGVAASERSAGKRYAEAVHWLDASDIPSRAASLAVTACDPRAVEAPIVFSALDSGVAGDVEAAFARAGRTVLSNAKNYRMEPDVPLVIAEVNPGHLEIVHAQRQRRGWSGAIITNGNCSTIVATLALAPIHERFGIDRVFVATMQAVSGAGYPGVPSLDILGNVIPFIRDEEEKVESELRKFLGTVAGEEIRSAEMVVSAHCNRVPVLDGHTICLSVGLRERATVGEVRDAMAEWRGAAGARGLPSAPERPVILSSEPDRPQPRRDLSRGGAMSVTVGRVREDALLDVRLVAMGDNIIRGAAGASVLNAELMLACGMLSD